MQSLLGATSRIFRGAGALISRDFPPMPVVWSLLVDRCTSCKKKKDERQTLTACGSFAGPAPKLMVFFSSMSLELLFPCSAAASFGEEVMCVSRPEPRCDCRCCSAAPASGSVSADATYLNCSVMRSRDSRKRHH